MYQISELAESVGLSRATLLYYEKLGLLKGKRQANGCRVYSDADRAAAADAAASGRRAEPSGMPGLSRW